MVKMILNIDLKVYGFHWNFFLVWWTFNKYEENLIPGWAVWYVYFLQEYICTYNIYEDQSQLNVQT